MADEKFATDIDLGDGETACLDLRHAEFPLGWTARADAAAAKVHVANTARPAATDWTAHTETLTVAADDNGLSDEPTPIAWLRFTAGSGGAARIGVATAGRAAVHRSTDALTVDGAIADISGLASGDKVVRGALDELFAYGGPVGPPALSFSVAASASGVANGKIVGGAYVEISAVGSGTVTLTVTARAPAGQTATLTFSVTVA